MVGLSRSKTRGNKAYIRQFPIFYIPFTFIAHFHKLVKSHIVKWSNESSFLNYVFCDMKVDYFIVKPAFNNSGWSVELLQTGGGWQYGATLFYKIKSTTLKSALTGVRNTLLPKVISGEVGME
jgi:hypothetical protein